MSINVAGSWKWLTENADVFEFEDEHSGDGPRGVDPQTIRELWESGHLDVQIVVLAKPKLNTVDAHEATVDLVNEMEEALGR